MNAIWRHKYRFGGLLLLTLLFAFSVHLRQDRLNQRMSPVFEGLTAHTLITAEIWYENGGPQAYNFCPVYTYPGTGNKFLFSLGGMADEQGNVYYVSYPPFAFIFAYYTTSVLGGPTLANIRTVNLLMHFSCAVLIFLIILALENKREDHFTLAPLVGSVLYLFSTGTLWAHVAVYFADTVVQLFILLFLLLIIKLVKGQYQSENRLLIFLALIAFLGAYTEWQSVFLSFFSGLFFLFLYIRRKKKIFLKAFLITGIMSTLAITITIFQYASIASLDQLIEVSAFKYAERSGANESFADGSHIIGWSDPESFRMIEASINAFFLMGVNILGISLLVLITVLIWPQLRKKIGSIKWKVMTVALLTSAILLHYVLFLNFNAIHNFSSIKTGILIILTIAIAVSILEEALKGKLMYVLSFGLLFLLVSRGIRDYKRYEIFQVDDMYAKGRLQSAQLVKTHGSPEKLVILNIYPVPEYVYQSHHNAFMIHDTVNLGLTMLYLNASSAQYYHHENDVPIYMLELEQKDGTMDIVHKYEFE